MSTSKCNKCEAIFVDNNNVIKCFGGCNRMFHFGCSSLSNANAKLCNNNPNIKFLCADCLNSHSNHQQLIQSLMVQLNEFSNLLTNLFANFQAVSNLIVCPTNTAATLRSNTFVNNNSQDAVISGTDSSNTQLEIVKPKKYLHVSNFKPSTTCEDIKKHLHNKLQVPVEDIECHELVSKRVDRSLLNFISFKVGLDSAVFERAFDGSIWPLECAVKQFINFRRPRRVPDTATLPA